MKSEFLETMDKIQPVGYQYFERFAKHPYLGHEHHYTVYDVGTVRTPFQKIESKKAKQLIRDNFPSPSSIQYY